MKNGFCNLTDGDPLPDKLRLKNGQLYCADGEDVQKYLRRWARASKLKDEPLVLMKQRSLQTICDQAHFLEIWAS
jgi:hypothetical protein